MGLDRRITLSNNHFDGDDDSVQCVGENAGGAWLVGEPNILWARERQASVAPAPRVAWSIVGVLGWAFAALGIVDIGLTWYPLELGNPEWEFGTVSSTLDHLPLFVLGLGLVVASGAVAGRRWLVRGGAVAFLVVAAATVAMAVLYATDVPLALRSTPREVAVGLKKAVAKTAAQAVIYPVVLGVLGVGAWRLSRIRS